MQGIRQQKQSAVNSGKSDTRYIAREIRSRKTRIYKQENTEAHRERDSENDA